MEGGGVVCGGVDDGEAEVIVALKEMSAGDAGADFGVAGDGGVAIDDEVAVRDDGAGIELGWGRGLGGECGGTNGEEEWGKAAMQDGAATSF